MIFLESLTIPLILVLDYDRNIPQLNKDKVANLINDWVITQESLAKMSNMSSQI